MTRAGRARRRTLGRRDAQTAAPLPEVGHQGSGITTWSRPSRAFVDNQKKPETKSDPWFLIPVF